MIVTLAAEPAVTVSIVKLIVAIALLLGWAKWATIVSGDATFFHLNARLWNAVQIGAVLVAFAALLLIPFFLIGFVVSLGVLIGAGAAYVASRNKLVAEPHRWHFDMESIQEIMLERKRSSAAAKAALRFPKPGEGLEAAPAEGEEWYEAHMLLEEILDDAISRGGQRINLACAEKRLVAVTTIDGLEQPPRKVQTEEALRVIEYLKRQCGLDPSEHRRKQIGRCPVEAEEQASHELRVLTAGSTRGLTCTILIDPEQQLKIPLKESGLLDGQTESLEDALKEGSGVVLVAAPSQEGLTNTLYALLERQDAYTVDIHTLEFTVERELEGVTQHEVEAGELARRIDSLLLRDPQVLMVAEVTDREVAQSIARGAEQGKLIYAGLRAADTQAALQTWLRAIGDVQAGTESLAVVMAQRLVRRLCSYCKQRYTPDEGLLNKLNLPVDKIKRLYKAGGQIMVRNKPEPCPACHGSGYKGRIAAFELVVMDSEGRQLIREGRMDAFRSHMRRKRTMWMQEAALSHAVKGITSVKEVLRVLGADREREKEKIRPAPEGTAEAKDKPAAGA